MGLGERFTDDLALCLFFLSLPAALRRLRELHLQLTDDRSKHLRLLVAQIPAGLALKHSENFDALSCLTHVVVIRARLVGQKPHLQQCGALQHLDHLKESGRVFISKHIRHDKRLRVGVFVPYASLKELVEKPLGVELH